MKDPMDTPKSDATKPGRSDGSRSLGGEAPTANDGSVSGRESGYRDRPTDDGMHGDEGAEQAPRE